MILTWTWNVNGFGKWTRLWSSNSKYRLNAIDIRNNEGKVIFPIIVYGVFIGIVLYCQIFKYRIKIEPILFNFASLNYQVNAFDLAILNWTLFRHSYWARLASDTQYHFALGSCGSDTITTLSNINKIKCSSNITWC